MYIYVLVDVLVSFISTMTILPRSPQCVYIQTAKNRESAKLGLRQIRPASSIEIELHSGPLKKQGKVFETLYSLLTEILNDNLSLLGRVLEVLT